MLMSLCQSLLPTGSFHILSISRVFSIGLNTSSTSASHGAIHLRHGSEEYCSGGITVERCSVVVGVHEFRKDVSIGVRRPVQDFNIYIVSCNVSVVVMFSV